MKILSSLILSFVLIVLLSCSDSGKGIVGSDCMEELDCNGVCGGSSYEDVCGVCDGDGSTCNISFSGTIVPIFTNCIGCHGSSGGLSLTSYENLMAGNSFNGPVVISENGAGSLLIQKLRGTASGSKMPASGCCLDASVIQLIETWIDEGALDN